MIRQAVALAFAAVLVVRAAWFSDAVVATIDLPLTAVFGLYGFVCLGHMAEFGGKIDLLAGVSRWIWSRMG